MGTLEAPPNNSKGCGAVMRMAPVGLFFWNEPARAFDKGCEFAAITHGHPSGYLAAGCLATIISGIMAGATLHDATERSLEILATKPGHEECSTALERAIALSARGAPSPESVEPLGKGWIAEEALAIAVYCALVSEDDFSRGVLLAVNHGGDSDSTGAIAGNILGALGGKATIPARWLERLELREEIEALANDLLTQYRNDRAWWERYPGG
jgi:ADP-ribosyl-[dinitrogen reductase] hydrolase